jgi:hypothetical protein
MNDNDMIRLSNLMDYAKYLISIFSIYQVTNKWELNLCIKRIDDMVSNYNSAFILIYNDTVDDIENDLEIEYDIAVINSTKGVDILSPKQFIRNINLNLLLP